MNPETLIWIARLLARIDSSETPINDELRKAISCAYYALFHALCNCVAEQWIGFDEELRGSDAWVLAYRLLEHGKIKAACIKISNSKIIPQELKTVAQVFLIVQSMRHRADYDPRSRFSLVGTLEAINSVEEAIRKLMNADANDRMAFISFLAFPHRKD